MSEPTNVSYTGAAFASLANNVTNLPELQRTPTTFKISLQNASAGTAAAWTPAAGKKFRLMGALITVSKDAAAAAAENWRLRDAGADIIGSDLSSAALVATGQQSIYPVSFQGNGYLSVLANNVLGIYLAAALTTGYISTTVWGTEE